LHDKLAGEERAALSRFKVVPMDENEEQEPMVFLSVAEDTEIVGVAIHADVLLHLDTQILQMQQNPECPPHVKLTPLWAERSHLINRALVFMFEADEIEHLWREEPGEF